MPKKLPCDSSLFNLLIHIPWGMSPRGYPYFYKTKSNQTKPKPSQAIPRHRNCWISSYFDDYFYSFLLLSFQIHTYKSRKKKRTTTPFIFYLSVPNIYKLDARNYRNDKLTIDSFVVPNASSTLCDQLSRGLDVLIHNLHPRAR